MGPKCQHTGVDCDILSSRCANFDDKCFASGPGRDMYESTKIISERIMKGGMVRVFKLSYFHFCNKEDVIKIF